MVFDFQGIYIECLGGRSFSMDFRKPGSWHIQLWMVVSIGWFQIFTSEMVGNNQTSILIWLFRVPNIYVYCIYIYIYKHTWVTFFRHLIRMASIFICGCLGKNPVVFTTSLWLLEPWRLCASRTGARFWPKPLWDDAKGGSFWEGKPFEFFFRSEEVVWKNKVLKLEKVYVCENCSMSIYHFISFYIM